MYVCLLSKLCLLTVVVSSLLSGAPGTLLYNTSNLSSHTGVHTNHNPPTALPGLQASTSLYFLLPGLPSSYNIH